MRIRLTKAVVVLAVIGFVVGGAIVYKVFFAWFVRVPTGAMMNTILPGDHLVLGRSFGEISRGSVVVFQYPGDHEWYICRVVGLPGETIEIREKAVLINGQQLPEEQVSVGPADVYAERLEELSVEGSGPYRVYYNNRKQDDDASWDPDSLPYGVSSPFRVADGHFFLMGDNRDNSADSRYRGSVPRERIWGTVSIVYWSSFQDRNFEEHVRSERIFKRVR